jgi:LPS export ABC transporter protein LptC
MITQQSDTLTMIYTKNGQKDYRFTTPLMERYEFARDPYMEFRYGIEIITFDSLGNEASQLLADYAIYYEKRELWEARGNVRGRGEDGRRLYTQQIFWDEKTDKVYSNVDTKVVDGDDVFVGEGFESDSEFKDWVFRESEGRMWVDASQGESTDAAAKEKEGEKEGKKEAPKESAKVEQKTKSDTPKESVKEPEKPAQKIQPKREFRKPDAANVKAPKGGMKAPERRFGKPGREGREQAAQSR